MVEPSMEPDDGSQRRRARWLAPVGLLGAVAAVVAIASIRTSPPTVGHDLPHGPIAADVSGPMGSPVPYATDEQLETFERGEQVFLRRFDLEDGLGPTFNVTFCGACHERPTVGGSAGLYRNFFLGGTELSDGSFVALESAGEAGGVVRMYSYDDGVPSRPPLDESANVLAQRNPIPFFGVGLIAELPDIEILSRADPDDEDGDGISGRPNYDQGFVGRFGRKSQTVSIEGFIRGPLFNHMGVTTDPLSDAQKAALPVDSSGGDVTSSGFSLFFQAAAPASPLVDSDATPDPEMSTDDLFDLVAFSMLLAAPQLEDPSEQGIRGAAVFDDLGCGSCHTPRLNGPRGPLPVYSDLLLHDMGSDLADGIRQGVATGSEFRTQPLWGLSAVGPYLHDGRASTIRQAILMHGGEGQAARDRAARLSQEDWADLEEFLLGLGGRSQFSEGLVPADEGLPPTGALGGPVRELSPDEEAAFLAGRAVFDRDFHFDDGTGAPGFNGDSCRACHFDPVIGGSGPAGVNVMRHGMLDGDRLFVQPQIGQVIPKLTADDWYPLPQDGVTIFEHRQTPPLFGLGLVDALPDEVILANADPDDSDGDGISGEAAFTPDGRLGRFGWKANVPSLAEFVRDAVGTELGMTMEAVEGLTFGITTDTDAVEDAEFDLADAEDLLFFMQQLAPPPRRGDPDDPTVVEGERLFAVIGCAACHTPTLEGPDGPVALYSDLLLHEILPSGYIGIVDGAAGMLEFRTPPLWGIADTGPYLHDGSAATIDRAIREHAGEGSDARDSYVALTDEERAAVLAFLDSL